MENIIYKPVEQYHDKLEPVKNYREMVSHTIQVMKGYSKEKADKIAINIIKEKYKSRKIQFKSRKENGDLELGRADLFSYIQHHVKNRNVIAPSLTTYMPPEVKRSPWSKYMLVNTAKRSKEKKLAAEFEADGDKDKAILYEGRQNYSKTKNNTLSGLFVSPTSVVNNPTAHSSLTTMTRTMTSLTNACNERLLTGNRGLYTPEYALNSIINESTYCNAELIEKAIDVYGLHVPTVDEVVTMLKRSSDIYNRDNKYYQTYIVPYLEKLSPIKLAGIMYTLDMYHLWKYNDEFTRTLINRLMFKVTDKTEPMSDPSKIKEIETSVVYFAHNIFSDEIAGMGKDYERMNEAGHANNLYHTCLNIINVMNEYKLFFNAFFMTTIRPINSHRMQHMRRRSVNLSDTDSSGFDVNVMLSMYIEGMFDVSLGAKYLAETYAVNSRSIAFTGALTYLSSENIVHQLSTLSNSMNVEKKELRRLSMKNEWYWTTFAVTTSSKNYFADAMIKEGDIYTETRRETKGVELIANNIPEEVRKLTFDLMGDFLHGVRDNKVIELQPLINKAMEIEKMIIDSLSKGSTKYLATIGINSHEAYKGGKYKSMYSHHDMWKNVFEPKYGHIPEPPYKTVKIPVDLKSKKKIADWLDSLEDKDLVNRMNDWIEVSGKVSFGLIQIEQDYVTSNGIPEEILACADFESIVLSLTKQLKLIMGTFGLIVDGDRLLRDQFIERK